MLALTYIYMKETELKIRNAALKLFSKEGFSAVSTKRIAAEAEISEVTLFRYYATKRELHQDILKKNLIEPSLEYLQPQSFICQWHSDLNRFAGIMEQFILDNRALLHMQLKDHSRINEELPILRDFQDKLITFLTKYIELHYKQSEPSNQHSETILEGLWGIIQNHHLINVIPQDQACRRCCDHLIQAYYLLMTQ
jgi:AcrR family transcriptional regulator